MLFVTHQNLKYVLYFINTLELLNNEFKLTKEISLFKNQTSNLIGFSSSF